MNVFPSARSAFLGGDVDVLVDNIRLRPVTSGYTYDSTAVYVSAISGGVWLGSGVLLTGKSVVNGYLFADDATVGAISTGSVLAGALLYQDTGSSATSRLLAHYDRKADRVPVSYATNGGGFLFGFPFGVMKL